MVKKREVHKKSLYVLLRYVILLGLMFSLGFIYKILTPLTIRSVSGLLGLFYRVSVAKDLIMINTTTPIQIIAPCVAGSAYLLLLILNLSVPMNYKKRIYSIALSFAILFTLNILRIFILSVLLVNNFKFFDFTHKLFWYVLSTIFVIGIWFLMVKIFSIKEIPVYSDIKPLIKDIKGK